MKLFCISESFRITRFSSNDTKNMKCVELLSPESLILLVVTDRLS